MISLTTKLRIWTNLKLFSILYPFDNCHISLLIFAISLWDYLSIPLSIPRYPMLMTNQTMAAINVFFWVVAHIFPGISTINVIVLPFCGPNKIIQVFCDRTSLTALVCGDTSREYSIAYAIAMFILYVPLALIIFSYICIIISILHTASGQVR